MKRPVSLYSLAMRPDSTICMLIKEIKIRLREIIGGHYASVNSEAHISLFEFFATDLHYQSISNELKKALARLQSFEINFLKFDEFRHSNTFFVKPSEGSSENIIRYCEQIRGVFKSLWKSKRIIEYRGSSFKNPHMTVARRLTMEVLNLVMTLFTKFEGKFLCDAFVIRIFNPETRQSDESGVQLTLF